MSLRQSVKIALRTWPTAVQSLVGCSNERKFHAYCVGLPRSGTHSMAYVLAGGHRARHEARIQSTLFMTLEWIRGRVTDQTMRSYLKYRDKRLNLEFEAAYNLQQVLPLLVDLFPDSRFVFTVREPLSWLESAINQSIKAQVRSDWRAFENLIYGAAENDFEYPVLEDKGAYPVRSYLDYWCEHVESVIDTVPDDRLYVVNTFDLNEKWEEISAFVGAEHEALDFSQQHSGKRSGPKSNSVRIGREIDKEWVQAQIEKMCLSTIEEYVLFLLEDMSYLD